MTTMPYGHCSWPIVSKCKTHYSLFSFLIRLWVWGEVFIMHCRSVSATDIWTGGSHLVDTVTTVLQHLWVENGHHVLKQLMHTHACTVDAMLFKRLVLPYHTVNFNLVPRVQFTSVGTFITCMYYSLSSQESIGLYAWWQKCTKIRKAVWSNGLAGSSWKMQQKCMSLEYMCFPVQWLYLTDIWAFPVCNKLPRHLTSAPFLQSYNSSAVVWRLIYSAAWFFSSACEVTFAIIWHFSHFCYLLTYLLWR